MDFSGLQLELNNEVKMCWNLTPIVRADAYYIYTLPITVVSKYFMVAQRLNHTNNFTPSVYSISSTRVQITNNGSATGLSAGGRLYVYLIGS